MMMFFLFVPRCFLAVAKIVKIIGIFFLCIIVFKKEDTDMALFIDFVKN